MRPYFCVLFILLFWHSFSFADALNTPRGLSSKDQLKVLGVIAKGYANNEQSKMLRQQGSGCNTQIGVTILEKGATAPRAVTTIINGSPIIVCR